MLLRIVLSRNNLTVVNTTTEYTLSGEPHLRFLFSESTPLPQGLIYTTFRGRTKLRPHICEAAGQTCNAFQSKRGHHEQRI